MWLRHDKIRMERIATLLVAHLQTAQANTLTKFAKEPPSQHTTDKERMKEQRGITGVWCNAGRHSSYQHLWYI